jgi:uncharacterized ferritin-like protein (DUF455 family)
VKRFIHPEALARDARFRRVNNRNQLLANLPDDVDTVVRIMEQAAPALEARVRGTPQEALFRELGPGFLFLTSFGEMRPGSPHVEIQLRTQLHGIFVGELQALEAAGRTVWDFPEAPWEFKMNMARQCWDEARHVQIYEKLLEHAGGKVGDFSESTFLFETSCHDDPVLRVTGVNRCLEGLACDVFRSLMDFAEARGDGLMRQAVDFVLADELTHVRFGSDWVREFTRGDPERAMRAKEFQREVDRSFSFGGSRRLAHRERLEAGFSEEEIAEIESLGGGGPSRDTLRRAGAVLRDRHLARLRGETVAPLEAPVA